MNAPLHDGYRHAANCAEYESSRVSGYGRAGKIRNFGVGNYHRIVYVRREVTESGAKDKSQSGAGRETRLDKLCRGLCP
jgi:hypothetical protein